MELPNPQDHGIEEPQVLSLRNISTVKFSKCGWAWLGKVQLIGTQNYPRQEYALHSEVEALRWAMENML